MNWIGGGIVLVCLVSAANGYRRGLVRTVLAMVSFVVVMAVAMIINPIIGDVVVKVTKMDQVAVRYVDGMLTDFMIEYQNNLGTETQADFIRNLPLPGSLQEGLLENNNQQIYQELGVTSFKEYIAAYLGDALVSGVILIISLIVAFVVVKLMGGLLDEVAEMPVLNTFNRVGGLGLGLFKGMVYIWIFFLIVTVMAGTNWGGMLMRMIYRDFIAEFLYEHNPVFSVLAKLLL